MSKTTAVVCDAGPLIHLDEVGCLSLLNDFDRLLVPVQVWREVAHHRPVVLTNRDTTLEKIEVTIATEPTFQALVTALTLDLGEQAALTLMQTYPRAMFLTDDAAARLAANTLGYQVHGTIGIIVRAIRRRQRTKAEVLTILRELPGRSTLHVRPALLRQVIQEIKKGSP